jgi:hypothetical protein
MQSGSAEINEGREEENLRNASPSLPLTPFDKILAHG